MLTPKTKEEFDSIIKGNPGKRIVVDFYATWCGPCRMIAPKFEEFLKESEDCIGVKIDVDQVEEVASEANVTAMPTFHLYINGEKKGEVVGASEAKLKELFSGKA